MWDARLAWSALQMGTEEKDMRILHGFMSMARKSSKCEKQREQCSSGIMEGCGSYFDIVSECTDGSV